MNKLQKIIQTSQGDGVATLQELMNGTKDNRNLSPGMRKMIRDIDSSPWYSQDGSLYWVRLVRGAGKGRLSQENYITWRLLRAQHLMIGLAELDMMFRLGGNYL